MKYLSFALGVLALRTAAFPFAMMDAVAEIAARQAPGTDAAKALSASRTNCGVVPCTVFSETEQYVSTTGDHAYASPAPDEIRGVSGPFPRSVATDQRN